MNPIDLIVTVCAVLSPATCEETHLVFSYSGSLQQCVMAAPPYIAQWAGEHPKWQAVKEKNTGAETEHCLVVGDVTTV